MEKKDLLLVVEENSLLMQFLLQKLTDRSRDNIKSLLRNKQVYIKGKAVSQFNHTLQTGDKVEIKWARASDLPSAQHLNIVYEDEDLIVIDKQAGLLSVSDGNERLTAYGILSEWVKQHKPTNKVYIVHRLDQYTSGLLMFAKNEKVQNIFRNDWKTYIRERTYTAVVEGMMKKKEGLIRSYLAENNALVMVSSQDPAMGKLAITRYSTLRNSEKYSLLSVNLETGKKNQIRVHMKDIGHSVAGDKKYGASTNPIRRLCLHATVLAFTHPVTGKPMRFESKIPGEFLRLFTA